MIKAYKCLFLCILVCMNVCMYVSVCIDLFAFLYVWIFILMLYVYIYLCLNESINACIYVYIIYTWISCVVCTFYFGTVWDLLIDKKGEFVYRNAAKVLVTQSADASLYQLGLGTQAEPSVRYIIVHKLLVLDSWLQSGLISTYTLNILYITYIP